MKFKLLLFALIISPQFCVGNDYVLRSDAPPPDHYADRLFKTFNGDYTLDDAKSEDIGYIYYLLSILDDKKFEGQTMHVFRYVVVRYKRFESSLSPEDKTRIIAGLSSHMTVGWSDQISVMAMSDLYQIKDVRVKQCLEKFTDHKDPYVKSVALRLVASLETELAAPSVPNNPTPPPSLKPTPVVSAKPTTLPAITENYASEQTSSWLKWSVLLLLIIGNTFWLIRRRFKR